MLSRLATASALLVKLEKAPRGASTTANVSLRCCQAVAAWEMAAKPSEAVTRLHHFISADKSCKT